MTSAALGACKPGEPDPLTPDAAANNNGGADGSPTPTTDAGEQAATPDAGKDCGTVTMFDTHAQALYLDGTYGPLTGIIYVDYVLANTERTLEFWHGHGGQQHRFTLTPAHFAALKRGEKIYVETTEVDDHMHMLFIDPTDLEYRVEGAQPVSVPLDDC